MASFDLEDLIPDLVASLRTPGSTEFDNVSPSEWANYLRNGFWEAVLDGFLGSFQESEGLVSPKSGSGELTRDLQQLIILYTNISILRIKLGSMKTSFRAKAGSVLYETQQSATVLKALLDEFTARRARLIETLSDSALASTTWMIDSFQARQRSINDGLVFWVN